MKTVFLTNIKTAEQLKREYKRLALILHPDCGGSNEDMKILNKEYEYFLHRVGNIHEKANGEVFEENKTIVDDGFKEVIDTIASLINSGAIIAEICGSWLWVTSPKEHKEILKSVGFNWSSSKKKWYWCGKVIKKKYRKTKSMEEIRALYGSIDVNSVDEKIALN